jgi:isocitrate dehydrogenase (NAD+)
MMLDRMGQRERAVRLEQAVRKVIGEGRDLTPDLGGQGTTGAFTDRVVAAVEA